MFTRGADGSTTLYVDDVAVAAGTSPGGLGAWGDYTLTLANEAPGDRPWLGQLFLMALYDQALSPADVTQNYEAGPGTLPVAPTIALQPGDQAVPAGSPATFTVAASGSPLLYQWERFDVTWNPIPGATASSYTLPGTVLADDGTEFRCVVSNSAGSDTSDSALLTILPASPRVTAGLLALYEFATGTGTTVADSSNQGAPLNLSITDLGAVSWLPGGGLSVDSSVVITSAGPATKIIDAVGISNAITLEAWVQPAQAVQSGPARIVALSTDGFPNGANIILGQDHRFAARLRTTATSQYGLPGLATPSGVPGTALAHVVYVRDAAGNTGIYVDGVLASIGSVTGTMDVWDATRALVLANEPPGDRPWLGDLHLVAFFDRALTEAEVLQNFAAGPHPSAE